MDLAIEQYHPYDFKLTNNCEHSNPFTVVLSAEFTHESGEVRSGITGFYDGNSTWVVRFSPSLEGRWTGKTTSDETTMDGISLDPLNVVPSKNPKIQGLLGIDPEHIQRFQFENGNDFVPIGFECDWLFSYHQADPDQCMRHVDRIVEGGFNYVVTNLYAHTGFAARINDDPRPVDPNYLYAPSDLYIFAGTNNEPDHSRLNPAFFQDFDTMMHGLLERGVVVHLMIQVLNKVVNWPERSSAEDNLFWNYVVARYQAFGNLVWDICKESKYLLRDTGSHDYTLNRMALIRSCDAYGHMLTVHDAETRNAGSDFSEPDRQSDFVNDQVHLGDTDGYNREAIRRLKSLPKPYMNIEYGYELGMDPLKTYRSKTTTTWDNVLKWTWAILAAGAYPCYYYDNTSWDVIKFEPEPPSWARYRELKAFIDTLPFNSMTADNEYVDRGMCLADSGNVYMVYLPNGGDFTLDLSGVDNDIQLAADWMEIYTGARKQGMVEKEAKRTGGFMTPLTNPFGDDVAPCVVAVRCG
jgi:hypothetical protein